MTKETISTLVHKRFRETSKNFRKLKERAAIDPVHDFRVDIKKLRAILRLLSMELHQPIKIPARLKKIYRAAGIIREMQVLEFRHDQTGMFSVFKLNEVKTQKKKELGKLRHLVADHQLGKDEKETMQQLPLKLSYRTVLNFFSSKLEEIKKLLGMRRISDEVMHQVRKLIKDLLYCAQLLEKETNFTFPYSVWNKNKENYYESLGSALGEYHDQCVEAQFQPDQPKRVTERLKFKKQLLGSLRKNIDEADPELPSPKPLLKKSKKAGSFTGTDKTFSK